MDKETLHDLRAKVAKDFLNPSPWFMDTYYYDGSSAPHLIDFREPNGEHMWVNGERIKASPSISVGSIIFFAARRGERMECRKGDVC